MKGSESLAVISVELHCKVNLSALNVSKWLTVENIR